MTMTARLRHRILLSTISLRLAFRWMLAVLLCLSFGSSGFGTVRPNVLMNFVDDLRPSLGGCGDKLMSSPNIDRFAGK